MAKRNNYGKGKFKSGKNKNKKAKEENTAKNVEEFLIQVNNTKKCFKAKEYLEMFESSRESWKFNKMLQVFILNYILVKDVFNKKYYEIFKGYLQKMNEKSKKEFIEKCTKLVQNHQEGTLNILGDTKPLPFKDEEKKTKVVLRFHKRCVDLIENCE